MQNSTSRITQNNTIMSIADSKIQITVVLLFPWLDGRALRLDILDDAVIQILFALRILLVVAVWGTTSSGAFDFSANCNLLFCQQVFVQIDILVNQKIILPRCQFADCVCGRNAV